MNFLNPFPSASPLCYPSELVPCSHLCPAQSSRGVPKRFPNRDGHGALAVALVADQIGSAVRQPRSREQLGRRLCRLVLWRGMALAGNCAFMCLHVEGDADSVLDDHTSGPAGCVPSARNRLRTHTAMPLSPLKRTLKTTSRAGICTETAVRKRPRHALAYIHPHSPNNPPPPPWCFLSASAPTAPPTPAPYTRKQ